MCAWDGDVSVRVSHRCFEHVRARRVCVGHQCGRWRARGWATVRVRERQRPRGLAPRGGEEKPQTKAWRDIWGCGQGIGTIKDVPTTADAIERMAAEHADAAASLERATMRG